MAQTSSSPALEVGKELFVLFCVLDLFSLALESIKLGIILLTDDTEPRQRLDCFAQMPWAKLCPKYGKDDICLEME